MTASNPSSSFTKSRAVEPFGPPLIGALLRMPWEAVQQHMLERLHERGFDDLDAAHLNVFQYPGPQGARPSELAIRLRISKQALNYLLGELERLDYLERRPDPDDLRSKRIALTRRGTAAIGVIREAVGEIEATWAQRLGPKRFAELRSLLLELNQPTNGDRR
jgi:DNA-binding MarR family transcriptional regulator